MTLPTLTAPPTAPSRSDSPATFIIRADAMIAWFGTFVPEMTALGDAIIAQAGSTNFGTSSTSLAIGTGSKSLTIQAGKGFQVGQFVMLASTASPSNFMNGQVTAYNSGTGALVVNVATVGGTGTFAAWTVSLAPATGGAQLTGATFTGLVTTAAPTTGSAGFNLPHGTAPTSPANGDMWTTTSGVFACISGTTRQLATLAGSETLTNKTLTAPQLTGITVVEDLVMSGTLLTVASSTTEAGFNLPHGAAPTSPVNGDLWTTTTGLFVRLNGTTRQFATLNMAETLTNKTLTSPTINTPTINGGPITGATITQTVEGSTIMDPVGEERRIGFRGIVPRAAASAQTLAFTDNGTEIEITSGGVTVPQNSAVALPSDFVCVIFNNSGSAQTITQGTGVTLRQVGSTNTGNRTLGPYGTCTIRASATLNLFKIYGIGLS